MSGKRLMTLGGLVFISGPALRLLAGTPPNVYATSDLIADLLVLSGIVLFVLGLIYTARGRRRADR